MFEKFKIFAFLTILAVFILNPQPSTAQEKKIIFLTQVPCMFIESEKESQNYTSKSISDCERVNKKTLSDRKLITLYLKAGTYTFRVKNENVPYELGFWLRGKGIKGKLLPTISGGGIVKGQTKDYEITLKPGEYLYSCPLNPTPNYTLIVK